MNWIKYKILNMKSKYIILKFHFLEASGLRNATFKILDISFMRMMI